MANNDILFPSKDDDLGLVGVLQDKFLDVCEMHRREKQIDLPIPADIEGHMKIWRVVFARFAHGHREHTKNEMKSVREFAQWLLDVRCDLCKQDRKVMEWVD